MEKAIDELLKLLQIPKENYSRVKQVIHCEDHWRVKNDKGKDNGSLQYKVWKHGRLQLKRHENNAAYGHQRTRVWDPRRMKTEGT